MPTVWGDQAVTHPSHDHAEDLLTLLIRGELAFFQTHTVVGVLPHGL
jgi:hypothetical protein